MNEKIVQDPVRVLRDYCSQPTWLWPDAWSRIEKFLSPMTLDKKSSKELLFILLNKKDSNDNPLLLGLYDPSDFGGFALFLERTKSVISLCSSKEQLDLVQSKNSQNILRRVFNYGDIKKIEQFCMLFDSCNHLSMMLESSLLKSLLLEAHLTGDQLKKILIMIELVPKENRSALLKDKRFVSFLDISIQREYLDVVNQILELIPTPPKFSENHSFFGALYKSYLECKRRCQIKVTSIYPMLTTFTQTSLRELQRIGNDKQKKEVDSLLKQIKKLNLMEFDEKRLSENNNDGESAIIIFKKSI